VENFGKIGQKKEWSGTNRKEGPGERNGKWMKISLKKIATRKGYIIIVEKWGEEKKNAERSHELEEEKVNTKRKKSRPEKAIVSGKKKNRKKKKVCVGGISKDQGGKRGE